VIAVRRAQITVVVAAVLAVLLAGCSGGPQQPAATRLQGILRLDAGHCGARHQAPTGSYLIVISAATGKAVPNPASGCRNHDYTLLQPGTEGGIRTGSFQRQPAPAFDSHRNARAGLIIRPTRFGRYRFGLATSSRDEQDAPAGAPAYPPPTALVRGNALSVDLRSLVLTYGGAPGATCRSSLGAGCWELGSLTASGTYDRRSQRFTLQWFTGESFVPAGDSLEVHLEGAFQPAST
jgi:hypothetical protein